MMAPMDMGKPYFSMVFMVFIIGSLPSADFGRDRYIVYTSRMPVMPATMRAMENPVTAPRVPKPSKYEADY